MTSKWIPSNVIWRWATVATFTVQLEIGPETRALIERLVGKTALQLELGQQTRELLAELIRAQRRPERRE